MDAALREVPMIRERREKRPSRVDLTALALVVLAGVFAMPIRAGESYLGRSAPGERLLDAATPLGLMSWDAYDEIAEAYATMSSFVRLREPLAAGEADVRYGLNAVLPVGRLDDIRNLSWAVVMTRDAPAQLFVDLNGNGILGDDDVVVFEQDPTVKGLFVAAQKVECLTPDGETRVEIPVHWKLDVGNDVALTLAMQRERHGTIRIEDDAYHFVLRTSHPRYDVPGSQVGLDLDGDGTIHFRESDVEVYGADEEVIAFRKEEFRLRVDPLGRTLELSSTGRAAGGRASLEVGSLAPPLPSRRAGSEYEDAPVLVSFWSPACGVSKRMAPVVREAWKEIDGARFISVTDVDTAGAASSLAEFDHEWEQITGEDGRTSFEKYRIWMLPTYYVIDARGVIRARGHAPDWDEVRSALEELAVREDDASR